ncbi:MAG: histidinol-phosphate transaminase [Candidatus Lokiarchaeota archaeon]|nr:histidinol-phosphate transaminase [Candidatus Lokiarchaeota archaeon]
MDLNNLIREPLKKYSPYEPGEQPTGDGWIKLNTNENAFPPLPEILGDIKNAINDRLRKYPDPTAFEVRKLIVSALLIEKDTLTDRNTVFVGNGCDEVLDTIFKVFVDPGDEVVFFYPSYGMYSVLASLYGAKINEIKLNEDFSLPEPAFNAKGKVMFINSPNNPNGKSFDNDSILKICKNFPGIVVVDETYADFSEKTSLPLLKQADNLIVARTFSKTFSLASLRFGYALADKDIIKLMNNVKLPYNANMIAQVAAISCIKHRKKLMEQNKLIVSERKRLTDVLNSYNGVSVLPSDANFVLVKFEDKSITLKFLWDLKEKKKILVRHFSKTGLYNYLRVSIGTKYENDKFLEAFKEIAAEYL